MDSRRLTKRQIETFERLGSGPLAERSAGYRIPKGWLSRSVNSSTAVALEEHGLAVIAYHQTLQVFVLKITPFGRQVLRWREAEIEVGEQL